MNTPEYHDVIDEHVHNLEGILQEIRNANARMRKNEDASPSFGVVMLLERARAELNIIDRAVDCLAAEVESPGVPAAPFQMVPVPPAVLEKIRQEAAKAQAVAEVKSTEYAACNCGDDCYQKDEEDQPCWGQARIRDADQLPAGEHRCDGHRDPGVYHHLPQAH